MKRAATSERELWNEKYAAGSHTLLEPDPFLLSAFTEFVNPLHPQPGVALDVAGGIGRHALWLARAGWRVTVADVSDIALAQAKEKAKQRNANIDTLRADLSTRAGKKILASKQFDLVLVFFYLEQKLFPALINALKPGGLLIYKTYTVDQLHFPGGPKHPLHLLQPNELLGVFRKLRVLHYRETVKDKGVAEFVGVKQR